AEFVDVDDDGDLDLYVASGGFMFEPHDKLLQDRLYLNDGKGNFARTFDALPSETNAGSVIESLDVNSDGHIDLFIGSSFVPGRYPEVPFGMLLVNNGKGKFSNAISSLAPDLEKFGMVTDALSVDLNQDGKMDVIVVGQWTNIGFFLNIENKLLNRTQKFLERDYKGWWNCISSADFDQDGDIDLLVGNYGTNSHFKVSVQRPASLTYKDFNSDGKIDPFFCYFVGDKSYPYASRDEALGQVSFLQKRFTDYASYSRAILQDIFTQEDLKDSKTLSTNILETVYLENKGGVFVQRSLPTCTQFSPTYAICATDLDNDGDVDVVLGGNETMVRVRIGKSDASYATVLINDGRGNFNNISTARSGLSVVGDIRSLKPIHTPEKTYLTLGITNQKVRSFSINAKQTFSAKK
ncbi:MAG: FG-GAP repeat domain-containing protein, partial [Flammeovirgaceae bacterium]